VQWRPGGRDAEKGLDSFVGENESDLHEIRRDAAIITSVTWWGPIYSNHHEQVGARVAADRP